MNMYYATKENKYRAVSTVKELEPCECAVVSGLSCAGCRKQEAN